MLGAVREHKPAIVYLAYPNNPTANLWDDAVIDRIIAAAPGLVVIDEAYLPFARDTWLPRLGSDARLLVLRAAWLAHGGAAGAPNARTSEPTVCGPCDDGVRRACCACVWRHAVCATCEGRPGAVARAAVERQQIRSS